MAEVDRGTGVLSYVLAFEQRVLERRRLLDPALANFPAVGQQREDATLGDATVKGR